MIMWDILGIEPTSDLKTIKRAYAKQLKIYHPEDDPEGFQSLREAYEIALRQAQYIKSGAEEEAAFDDNEVVEYTDECGNVLEEDGEEKKQESNRHQFNHAVSEDIANEFIQKIEEICNNNTLRMDRNEWQRLLDDETFWSLEIKQRVNHRVLDFFIKHYQLPEFQLPAEVWRLLNQHFFWTEQKVGLFIAGSGKFFDFIEETITPTTQSLAEENTVRGYPAKFWIIAALVLNKFLTDSIHLDAKVLEALLMAPVGIIIGKAIIGIAATILVKRGFQAQIGPLACFYAKRSKWKRFIPLFVYFVANYEFRKGCKGVIRQALFIEVFVGNLFLLTDVLVGKYPVKLWGILIISCLMLIICIVDYISQKTLDTLVIALIIIGVIYNFILGKPNMAAMIMGGIVVGGIPLVIALLSKGRIGRKFFKVAGAIGLILGIDLAGSFFTNLIVGMLVVTSILIILRMPLFNRIVRFFFGNYLRTMLVLAFMAVLWKTGGILAYTFSAMPVVILGFMLLGAIMHGDFMKTWKTVPVAPVVAVAAYMLML